MFFVRSGFNRSCPSYQIRSVNRLLNRCSGVLVLLSTSLACCAQDLKTQRSLYKQTLQPLVEKYCLDCHGKNSPEGDFDLASFQSADEVLQSREHWLKALQRVRFGDMPPPEEVTLDKSVREEFQKQLDELLNRVDCSKGSNPGQVTIRRLNRNEYRNTVKELIGLDYRPAAGFPGDDVGYGFDNIGDVLSLPPILFEKYLVAAETISGKAIVTRGFEPDFVNQTDGKDLLGDGAPRGNQDRVLTTEGTARLRVKIPTTGSYEIELVLYGDQAGDEPVKVELISGRNTLKKTSIEATREEPVTLRYETRLQQGIRSIGIRFLNDFYDPTLPRPAGRDRNLYIESILVRGPTEKKVKLPETHQKIFFVSPGEDMLEAVAARRILTRIASRAFRRPVTENEMTRLLKLVRLAKINGDNFETGIQLALQAILVSPHFLFKVEKPVVDGHVRVLDEFELATSLSFFVWSSMPDDALFKDAFGGRIRSGDRLQRHVKRMLADPRSAQLVRNFVGQWLQLRNLKDISFDGNLFPGFSPQLAAAMKKETELFAWDLLRRDGSLLDFLEADYTFVNRELAEHYGIEVPTLKGKESDRFEKISLAGTPRGGILTQGSVLTLTSNPTRTSPVKRGRWVLENLLNLPPPPPAPNVMEIEDQKQLVGTLRQKMQQHRENPGCASCHAQMDPIGFALENFDAIGRWREVDQKLPIDASGELTNGAKFEGAQELQKLLTTVKKDQFIRCIVEKMLTFALGRGIEYYDRCAVDKIMERLARADYRFSELICAIVESDPFQKRKGISP